MANKIVYVLPGDLLEIRVCDPVFDEGANRGAWMQSMDPSKMTIEVVGYDNISVYGIHTLVSKTIGFGKRKYLE